VTGKRRIEKGIGGLAGVAYCRREANEGARVYRLPSPEEGGIGPRQRPFRSATGWSSLGHHTVNVPFLIRTSTISALSPFLVEKHKQARIQSGVRIRVNRELAMLKAW
jgi:hypothetical protein